MCIHFIKFLGYLGITNCCERRSFDICVYLGRPNILIENKLNLKIILRFITCVNLFEIGLLTY